MAQRLQVNLCTAALVALLSSTLQAAHGQAVDVKEASTKDFGDAGELILPKVAARVRFFEAVYGKSRDITYTTLSATLTYDVVCRSESLRGSSESRDRSLDLIADAQEQLAGARLLLPDGSRSEPILLLAVLPVSDAIGPVADCYGLRIEVGGFAQFDGPNANPQQGGVTA